MVVVVVVVGLLLLPLEAYKKAHKDYNRVEGSSVNGMGWEKVYGEGAGVGFLGEQGGAGLELA